MNDKKKQRPEGRAVHALKTKSEKFPRQEQTEFLYVTEASVAAGWRGERGQRPDHRGMRGM